MFFKFINKKKKKKKEKVNIDDMQFGFMKGKGTIDASDLQ